MQISSDLAKTLFPQSLLEQINGDMPLQDLSPKDNNRGGRIIKNMRICGSGIYRYHISEAPLLGLVVDGTHGDSEWIDVYRPAEMLVANKDLYARVPIITGHHVLVNTENAKQLAVGMVGDTVLAEQGDDGETYLYTTGTIIAGDGIEAYEKFGELSVGYDPIIKWQDGEHNGKKYNAVMTGLAGVNHLLICKTARGGHQCMVMDSLDGRSEHIQQTEVKQMNLFAKIFAKPAEKEIAGDAKVVSAMLQSVKAGADAKTQVAAVQKMLGDKIDDTLKGYFEELSGDEVTKADKETLGKAIDIVDAYVQKHFGDEACACNDKPEQKEAGDADKPVEKKDDKPADDKPAGDSDKPKEEPKQNGDAIDYEKLATMVAEKLKPAKEEPKLNGDALAALAPVMGGDEKPNEVNSDNVLAAIF